MRHVFGTVTWFGVPNNGVNTYTALKEIKIQHVEHFNSGWTWKFPSLKIQGDENRNRVIKAIRSEKSGNFCVLFMKTKSVNSPTKYLTYFAGVLGNTYPPLSSVSDTRLGCDKIQVLLNGPMSSSKFSIMISFC